MKNILKYLTTGIIVAVAVLAVLWMVKEQSINPRTRDGQVRAEVIQIAPRVSGPIVSLPLKDNQHVAAGELLFQIDPRTFEAALAQAKAEYDKAKDNYTALENISVPILDLYGSEDLEQVLNTAELRTVAANKRPGRNYLQVEVDGANHFFQGDETIMVGQVLEWLDKQSK